MKPLIIAYAFSLLLACSAHGVVIGLWGDLSIPVDFPSANNAVLKTAEKKIAQLDDASSKAQLRWKTKNASLSAKPRSLPFWYNCSLNQNCCAFGWDIEFPESAKGTPALFGSAENYMLVYGCEDIRLFKLEFAKLNGHTITDEYVEIPQEFLRPKDAWSLQSLLTLDASYDWDDHEYSDCGGPLHAYRIKFQENGKTVSVDISIRDAHVRAIGDGAHGYGTHLSKFGRESLRNLISNYYADALLADFP